MIYKSVVSYQVSKTLVGMSRGSTSIKRAQVHSLQFTTKLLNYFVGSYFQMIVSLTFTDCVIYTTKLAAI